MSERTAAFQLSALGPGDDPTEESWKFFNRDRHLIDNALRRLTQHRHTGDADSVSDPTIAPSLTLDTGVAGVIPAGRRVYYRYAWVDAYGTESVGSPISFLDTPAAVATPTAPSGLTRTTTGGTLLPGSYYYRLSAYKGANTQETRASDPAFVVIPAGTSTNTITFTLPALPVGADGFNVYRRKPGGDFGYLTSIDMTGGTPPTTFQDTGAIVDDCVRRLPTANRAGSSNAILVELPVAVPAGYTWRLYRSYTVTWGNSLLTTVVEETSEGSGVITPEYLDLGVANMPGEPLTSSPLFQQPPKIDLSDGTEVEGVLAPAHVIAEQTIEFEMPGKLVVVTGTGEWVCPFERAYIREVILNLGKDSTPNATPVIVDVNKWDTTDPTPAWASLWTATPANRPQIAVGANNNIATPGVPEDRMLVRGDRLTVDVDQVGGGTNTDTDLAVRIFMWVENTTATTVTVFP